MRKGKRKKKREEKARVLEDPFLRHHTSPFTSASHSSDKIGNKSGGIDVELQMFLEL